ncbi:uncharacterized protein LOC142768422 [Rhipicephalus microplus]|uniref:uncharacterized protein LOC142768422 n=1 Tax=Rhipicephalus microplus TaxID=6941 RepID=UPI002376A952
MLVHAMHVVALATQCICRTYTPDLVPCSAKAGERTVFVTEAEVTELPNIATATLILQVQVDVELSPNTGIEVTIDNGRNSSCSSASGPCHYKLCDPITDIEEQLFEAFGSRCPVPSGSYSVKIMLEETSSPRDAESVPKVTIRLNITDKDKPVGCTALVFDPDNNSAP